MGNTSGAKYKHMMYNVSRTGKKSGKKLENAIARYVDLIKKENKQGETKWIYKTKERKLYHQYLIRVDDETIMELENLGFQFKTCFIWKKYVQTDELKVGEMSVDYSSGCLDLIFKEKTENSVENDNKTSVVEFFIEDKCRE